MSDAHISSSRLHRRRLCYSLRTLAVFISAGCIALGLWSQRAHRQSRAVAAVRDARGFVQYDFEGDSAAEPSSHWLREAFGIDYFARPTKVSFVLDADAGESLIHVGELTTLAELDLTATRLGDDDLRHLRGLRNLRVLILDSTHLGDDGLRHVSVLTTLEYLSLYDTHVSSAGLEHLAGLPSLTHLNLSGTRVGDMGMMHLSHLSNLRELDLRETSLSDDGLRNVSGLVNLEELWLHGTRVTEAGIEEFRGGLPNCETFQWTQ